MSIREQKKNRDEIPGNTYCRPMIPLTLALAAGIIAGDRWGESHTAVLLMVFLSGGVLAYGLTSRRISRIAPLLLMGSLGVLSIQPWSAPRLPPDHLSYLDGNKRATITGRVMTPPQQRGYRTSFLLDADSIGLPRDSRPVSGTLRLTVSGDPPAVACGDRIRFPGRIRRIRSFHNPGGFDYRRYMSHRGILASAWTRSRSIRMVEKGTAGALDRWFDKRRGNAAQLITANAAPRPASILKALLIGDRSGISTPLRTIFCRTGAGHLLAISGLHIGIVAGTAFFILRCLLSRLPFFLWRGWGVRCAALLALVPVWYYGLLAGMAPSTTRALVMVTTGLLAVGTGKLVDPFNTLALAAFALLLLHPPSIFSISFQLSFAAVLAILAGLKAFATMERESDLDGRGHGTVRRFALFALVSLCAWAGTLPFVMHYFHLVSLVSLPVNLLLVPAVGMVVVPLGLLSLFAAQFLPVAGSLGIKAAAILLDRAIGLLSTVADLPWAAVDTFAPTPAEIGLYWLLAGALMLWHWNHRACREAENILPDSHHRRWAHIYRLVAAVAFVAMTLNGVYWLWHRFGQTELQVTFVDVGQGSASLLELPGGGVVLVDGGGFSDNTVFDVGQRVLAPLLHRKKIITIDLMVLSHPSSDHLNGLIHILRHFKVRRVWTNGQTADTGGYRRFIGAIEDRGIPISYPGDTPHPPRATVINGVRLYPLLPFGTSPAKGVGANDASLVLRVDHGHISFLFPGDIERPAEMRLMKTDAGHLPSTILAAPHHGSSTSSSAAFLRRVAPECIIVSSGFRNRYHMPHPTVLARYHSLGAAVYRTDRQGAIVIRSDGHSYRVQPLLPPAPPFRIPG